MAAHLTILRLAERARSFSSARRGFKAGIIVFNKQQKAPPAAAAPSPSANVPGLSSDVVSVPSEPVGPGASKASDYKNPEYFCYDKTSYFQAEIEILKYRCPQPSNKAAQN